MHDDAAPERVPAGLRASPTGRVPQWVLDEASGRCAAPDPWRAWEPDGRAPGSGAPRRRRRTVLLGILAAVVVVSAALVHPSPFGGGIAGNAARPSWPTPGFEATDAPLGSPMAAPASEGPHVFTAVQEDGVRAVTYDPCRPVHYVIRPDDVPVGGNALLHDAFARVSSVTGLQFVYDGSTDEASSRGRELFQPDRYGDRWAPVLVAWQTEAENPELATDVAGLAGSAAVEAPGGPRVFVTGTVELDAAAFDRMLADQSGVAAARAVVLHELGHLVGLAHVSDGGQLMYPTTSAVLDFAPGDLSGLVELGRGECVPGV